MSSHPDKTLDDTQKIKTPVTEKSFHLPFKASWEKTSEHHQLSPSAIQKMLRLAYPSHSNFSLEIISGGCSNINIKIYLDKKKTVLLRVYLRDKDSAHHEQKLEELLKSKIPVPQTLYIGDCENYRFAITDFIHGISLRDLLLHSSPHDISSIMEDVGQTLAQITQTSLKNLNFLKKKTSTNQDLLSFARDCLTDKQIQQKLSSETI